MPTQDDIDHQRQLLATYRRNLAHELGRAAQYGGEPRAPVDVANGIAQARAQIAGIKAWLREQGERVEDLPGEMAAALADSTAPVHPRPATSLAIVAPGSAPVSSRRGLLWRMGRSTALIVIAALLFLANVVINLFSTAIEAPLREQIGASRYPSVLAAALIVCLVLAAVATASTTSCSSATSRPTKSLASHGCRSWPSRSRRP